MDIRMHSFRLRTLYAFRSSPLMEPKLLLLNFY